MEKVTFSDFVENLKSGKEILNEGTIPTAAIVGMVRGAISILDSTSNPSNCGMPVGYGLSKPSPQYVVDVMGIKCDENPLDNKDFIPTYEKICGAYHKAKMAYIETLNKELKTLK